MARPRHFHRFADDLGRKVHDFASDELRVILVSKPPRADDKIRADLAELPSGNGYISGGKPIVNQSWDANGGVGTLSGSPATWTAEGRLGPIFAAVLCNGDVLVCWWDCVIPAALGDGDEFVVPFDGREIFSIG